MRIAVASLLVASALLAGCDGGLHIAGQVVRPDGQPVADAKVTVTVDEDGAPREDLQTRADGRFAVDRVDCPCDFPVRIEVFHPQYGHAKLDTTHRALERDPNISLTLQPYARAEKGHE